MSINKFGASLTTNSVSAQSSQSIIRNLIHNNALCVEGESFNARGKKISCVGAPTAANDVASMQYVNGLVEELRTEVDQKLIDLRSAVYRMIETIERHMEDLITGDEQYSQHDHE